MKANPSDPEENSVQKETENTENQQKSYLQNLTENFAEDFKDEPFTVISELGMAFSIG